MLKNFVWAQPWLVGSNNFLFYCCIKQKIPAYAMQIKSLQLLDKEFKNMAITGEILMWTCIPFLTRDQRRRHFLSELPKWAWPGLRQCGGINEDFWPCPLLL